MKKIIGLLLCNLLVFSLFSQKMPIRQVTLSNGMNVVLCEFHEQPQIYGAVCVHVGAKNDPSDNTGMAHYLEHIMFKGTDSIGTLDWPSEKVYLDSISLLYDELHGKTDAKERNDILLHINNLSNKATQFAIPNEVDVILDMMGGEGVNAFTSNDVTVYHNRFPSNQLEKWLLVYRERFRHPVFRLFQSELEAVYEEYNMYQDEPMMVFLEDAVAEAYGTHPYGIPVIGFQKHLKNPQTSAMQKFFNSYYHPANMTLVLVGDFEVRGILPLLERTIGQLHNESDGVDPKLAKQTERFNTDLNLPVKPFSGHQIVTVKETPVKVGAIGFQTVGTHDEEAFYLDILGSLLNNESSTGLLDKLNNENKLFMSQGFNYGMLEHGMFAVFYVPKILGQSHEQAEALVFAALDSLRTGHFSDDLFEAVKMDYLTDYLTNMESLEDRFYTVLDLVTNKQTPEFYEKKGELLKKLTKDDFVKIAQKYLTDNCLIYRSNMGIKKHEKLQKPAWEPVVAQNTDAKSEFAKKIENMPAKEIRPQEQLGKGMVTQLDINSKYKLYASRNPLNDLFSLEIVYHYGTISDRKLGSAVEYFNLQGTEKQKFTDFQLELQKLGASLDVQTSSDLTTVSISGFDKDLPKILELCHEKLTHPANDEKMLSVLVDGEKGNKKMQKNDASAWGYALYMYALYGEKSPYLNKLSLKELQKISGDELTRSFAHVFEYDGYATYVGNESPEKVKQYLTDIYDLKEDVKTGTRAFRPLQTYSRPALFLASNSHFLQSNIYFYIQGDKVKTMKQQAACKIYNEFMGGSMAGVIFQEIRELRSLGYSAYGYYSFDGLNRIPGLVVGFLGTQADKTVEGCEAMAELLVGCPDKPEKFETAKACALKKMEASYISFRDYPAQVRRWQEYGFNGDPRQEQMELLKQMDFNQMRDFYYEMVGKNPLVITVAGDKKRIDVSKLAKTYEIKEVKYKDIFR